MRLAKAQTSLIMGVPTIYAETHLRTHLNRNYGFIIFQLQRFLDNMHTKCVWKSNSNVSNSNFGSVIYGGIICSKTPLRF